MNGGRSKEIDGRGRRRDELSSARWRKEIRERERREEHREKIRLGSNTGPDDPVLPQKIRIVEPGCYNPTPLKKSRPEI